MTRSVYFLLVLSVLSGSLSSQAQLLTRPSSEYRTMNTPDYEVRVQKNGRIDIILSSGMTMLENIQPAVLYDGEEAFESLRLNAPHSGREIEEGPLGTGPALMVTGDRAHWRIATYPTRPRFSVTLRYVNSGRKEVSVRALAPLALSVKGSGALRTGPAAAETWLLHPAEDSERLEVSQGGGRGRNHVALHNPVSGMNMYLGFVTARAGLGTIALERSDKAANDVIDLVSAATWFDPPRVLAPGESLESEVLLVSMERNWRDAGLRELAAARQVMGGAVREAARLPHGWVLDDAATNAAGVTAALESAAALGAPRAWNYLELAPNWAQAPGDWRPDAAAFPEGLAPMAAQAREQGLHLGLSLDPFVYAATAPPALEHPEWFRALEGAPDLLLLDPSQPGATEALRALGEAIWRDGQIDTVQLAPLGRARLDSGLGSDALTAVQALHAGLAAFAAAKGPVQHLIGAAPLEIVMEYADGWALGGASNEWSHRAYYRTEFDAPVHGPASANADRAALSRAALMGGGMRIAGTPRPAGAETLGRVVPVSAPPARPLNIFQAAGPTVLHKQWSQGSSDPEMGWDLIAVFGSGDGPQRLYLEQFGLDPAAYYTVYDFWAGQYLGTARAMVDVEVGGDGVRLLGLRRYVGRPQLVGAQHHFEMGAAEHVSIQRSANDRLVEGVFEVRPEGIHHYVFLIPDGFALESFEVSDGAVETTRAGNELEARISGAEASTVTWRLAYRPVE